MKTFILSTSLALGLGALAFAPANAAPMIAPSVAAPSLTSEVACRTVVKQVRRNGTTRTTRTQVCDNDRPRGYVQRRVIRDDRRVYRDRRDYRRNYRPAAPGLSIRVN